MSDVSTSRPRTLFEKVWTNHEVRAQTPDLPAVLYIDLHLVHEVTSPQAFTELRQRGLKVRRPGQTIATMDHSTPTTPRNAQGKVEFSAELEIVPQDLPFRTWPHEERTLNLWGSAWMRS